MHETILLTGARGLLGREILKVLSGDPQIKLVATDKAELDITRKENVNTAFKRLRPEIIINCAAYTNVNRAEEERELAFLVNAEGVQNLATASKEMGATLIHFSTDYVFSGDKKDSYKEDEEPSSPPNAYGASKLEGEKNLLSIVPNFYLIRTSWLFAAPSEVFNEGRGAGGKCFPETMIRLAEEGKELKVVCDQYGKPTYASDLARAVVSHFVLSQGETKAPFGIYHLTNSGVTNWYEFAREIIKNYGALRRWPKEDYPNIIPVASEEFPSPAQRPAFSVLQNTKLLPLRPWQEALRDYLRFHQLTD